MYNGSGQGTVDKVVDEEDVIETVVVTIFVIVPVEVVVEVEVLLDDVLVGAATVTYMVLVEVEVGVGVTVTVITAVQDRNVSFLPFIFSPAAERCRSLVNDEILLLTSSICYSCHHNLLQTLD